MAPGPPEHPRRRPRGVPERYRCLIALFLAAFTAVPALSAAEVPRLVFVGAGPAPLDSSGSNLTGTWTKIASLPGAPYAREDGAVAFDPVEGLGVLFGGRGANGTYLNDTWVDDGDTPGGWARSPYALSVAPPPLIDPALTFDPPLNEFLLFGGRLANGSSYDGTWAFTSFAWSDLTPRLPRAPPADPAPTMAFDATDGAVLLVSSSDPGATWSFGSGGWSLLPSADWLPPLTNATALSDPLLQGVLLFGGQTPGTEPVLQNSTWSFQGDGWQRVLDPASPPAEARPSMAYDPRIPGVLLYSSAGLVSTWAYTAAGWGPWAGGSLPPARAGAQFYYDSDAAYDSLFGGAAPNGTVLNDDWGWSVPVPELTPTLGAASIGAGTWAEVGAVVAVPIVIAFLLRRRPPRASPTVAPAGVASTAPG